MSNKRKINKNRNPVKKERVDMFVIIPIVVSIMSLGIAIYMAYVQYHYADIEYEYKVDPKLKVGFIPTIKSDFKDGIRINEFTAKNIYIEIAEKNNLRKVFLINSKNEVKDIGGIRGLEESLKNQITINSKGYDIEINGYKYKYWFLVFQSLDDDIDIHLIYTKSKPFAPDEQGIHSFESREYIGILEFDKGHENDEKYEGERIMAKQYKEIVKWYRENSI